MGGETYVLESSLVTSVLTVTDSVTSATSGMPIWTPRVEETPMVDAWLTVYDVSVLKPWATAMDTWPSVPTSLPSVEVVWVWHTGSPM